jgi:signal transduction histidine kinase
VSAGIVKEHNGMINFVSVLDQGTEVIVSLPAMVKAA